MTSFTSVNRAALQGAETQPRIVKDAAKGPDALKSALAYLASALFCAFFGAVYELFSHEVFSYFMLYAFAIPLALGALPNLVIALTGKQAPGKRAANLWNSGVAALTVGCIFKGALDIYGTTSQLLFAYPVAAALLLAIGCVLYARETRGGEHVPNAHMSRLSAANACTGACDASGASW